MSEDFAIMKANDEAETRQRDARLVEKEDAKLVALGFEPMGDDLWRKSGVWFGRRAALQQVRQHGS